MEVLVGASRQNEATVVGVLSGFFHIELIAEV
jgi:hypothetical protein